MRIHRCPALILLYLFCSAANGAERGGPAPVVEADSHFLKLERPSSPNHWLAAPAGFPGRPDEIAQVFTVPVAELRAAFKAVLLQNPRMEVAGESAAGLHAVARTRVFGFRDDIHVQFIALGPQQSTLALYSASRVGYWDFGTNRRRVGDLLARTATLLEASRP